jgi:hypothetical protein
MSKVSVGGPSEVPIRTCVCGEWGGEEAKKVKESSWPFPGVIFRPSFVNTSPPPVCSSAYVNHPTIF